jgi:hypothetical protein
VIQWSGVDKGLRPRKCSENASVSRVGSKIGSCHQRSESGRTVAFQWSNAATKSGSPSSAAIIVRRFNSRSRAKNAVTAT